MTTNGRGFRAAVTIGVTATVLCSVLLPAEARACAPANGGGGWTEPVVHDTTSPASLLRRAQALETEAVNLEASARAADQRGVALERRAHLLRAAALSAAQSERRRLLEQAFELETRADDERTVADGRRDEARQLRAEARRLRDRASAIGKGGGGWVIRPPRWRGSPRPQSVDGSVDQRAPI